MEVQRITTSRLKPFLKMVLAAVTITALLSATLTSALAASSYSIALEEFRWNSFPLTVLVDMNQWSTADYAVVVREALDTWIAAIWNYTDSFGGTTLRSISFMFHLSSVNSTSNYDVFITFAPDVINPGTSDVGQTTYMWDENTHEPIPPITINITTYQKTADTLFVKNVAMHEFGHALGLGHAAQSDTSNGPELMYYASAKDQIIYPSTLDVYGLTLLYQGTFNQTIQLPPNIPYKMLLGGSVPSPFQLLWYNNYRFLIILAALLFALILILAFGRGRKKPELEEPRMEAPPSSPPTPSG